MWFRETRIFLPVGFASLGSFVHLPYMWLKTELEWSVSPIGLFIPHLTALDFLRGHCDCPAFQKLEHLLKAPIWSLLGETMCGFLATKPSQLRKALEPVFFSLWKLSWPITLPVALGNLIQICRTFWSPVLLLQWNAMSVLIFSDSLRAAEFSVGSFDGAFSIGRPKNSSCLQAWNWLTLS